MKSLLLFSIPILMLSCKNSVPTNPRSEEVRETEQTTSSVLEIQLDKSYAPNKELFRFNVKGWEIKENVLSITISYSGGCEEDSFKAFYTGAWMKSLPPKMDIYLEHHTPKPDYCKALITKTIEIDISEVKYEGQNKVVLRSPNGKHQAFYEYRK